MKYFWLAPFLGLGLLLLAACGSPRAAYEPVSEQAVMEAATDPPPYLMRSFSRYRDAQDWANAHWPTYRVHAVGGAGPGYHVRWLVTLCNVEQGACGTPVIVPLY